MGEPQLVEQPRDDDTARRAPAAQAALSGLLAAAAGIGVVELAAGAIDAVPSLVISVGDAVIDSVPGWLERAAIAALGTNDKPVLLASIGLVAALLGAGTGLLARRSFVAGAIAFVLITALGVAAGLAAPDASPVLTVLAGVLGAAVGVALLHVLLAAASAYGPPSEGSGTTGRRNFLLLAGGAAAVAVIGGVGSRLLMGRERLTELRAAIRLPVPVRPAGPVPPGADLEIPGLTPLFIPNEEFYRIDTALRVPTIDPAEWQLEIRGMVDNPFTITYAELLEMPQIEADITLSCVSNEVGGDLVGNARWQGVPLFRLLERAGLQEGATQLIGRSVDGFTAGFPTLTALDVTEAMVAVGMNGEPLPAEHGFPARLVVPGLYGYVSATKWLSAIELTDWDVDGYWIPRGWAKEGPIKTSTRIDVPGPGRTITAGERPIAGVAWAPTRGIEAVEVRVDDGPWQRATLAERLDVDCWRQWYLPWQATPGVHVIAARATDGLGEVQTDERTPVAPDGASGYPVIEVVVEA
ncbi:molybdopterin-dependent oxidoreductase [Modestobacter sp. VKM Ac-2984]|uniref:molybdopterin-dependent oxidoreductase n=1 Tax=Modestobacter sp. VKM Ac-2984 TaxID=3004138 RepID=UPI0022AA6D73|nr:molybdopterin-dependent oxidoreductase [Modestobacter sp. VKM Ac-2984]MCZ2815282.1 molybdopterin-dependent oxidoreductase [Modestobacter sp. VKM Ac-2984]